MDNKLDTTKKHNTSRDIKNEINNNLLLKYKKKIKYSDICNNKYNYNADFKIRCMDFDCIKDEIMYIKKDKKSNISFDNFNQNISSISEYNSMDVDDSICNKNNVFNNNDNDNDKSNLIKTHFNKDNINSCNKLSLLKEKLNKQLFNYNINSKIRECGYNYNDCCDNL